METAANIDNIADNIAGNNADNKVDMCDSALYIIARSCGLEILVDIVNTLPFEKVSVDSIYTLPNDKILYILHYCSKMKSPGDFLRLLGPYQMWSIW